MKKYIKILYKIMVFILILHSNLMLPIYKFNNLVGNINIDISDLIIITIFLYYILYVINNIRFIKIYRINKTDNYVLLIIIINIISAMFGIVIESNYLVYIISSLIANIAPYLLYYIIRKVDENLIFKIDIINIILILSLVINTIGIIERIDYSLYNKILNIMNISMNNVDENYAAWRITSVFNNPNIYGNYLLIIISICFAKILEKPKIYIVIYIFMNILIIIFTLSREAWIGLVFIILIYMYLIVKKYGINNYNAFINYFIIVFILYLLFNNQSIIINRINYVSNSTSYRITIYKATIKYIIKFKMIGIGSISSTYIKNNIINDSIFSGDPHNTFLRIIAENGIVGLIIYIGMINNILIQAFKSIRKNKIGNEINYLLIFSYIGLIISGMFGTSFQDYPVIMNLMIISAYSKNKEIRQFKSDV